MKQCTYSYNLNTSLVASAAVLQIMEPDDRLHRYNTCTTHVIQYPTIKWSVAH